MGYSPEMFSDISRLGLPRHARIMDIGSQDVRLNTRQDLTVVNDFIRDCGDGEPFPVDIALPVTIEAMTVFERAGFQYLRSDVDERPGTIYVDLNKLIFPIKLKGSMDLVVNAGTTEHLANPIGGFALIHYLTKPGGLMFHDVPIFGYGNHGLTNPTPKFWHALVWMNSYQVINAAVLKMDESKIDQGNFYHDYLSYIKGLNDIKGISNIVRFVVRKTSDRVFIPPYDAVLPDSDGSKEANLVLGALYPFIMTGSFSEEEVFAGINDFLAMQGKSFRIGVKTAVMISPIWLIKTRQIVGRLKRWMKN